MDSEANLVAELRGVRLYGNGKITRTSTPLLPTVPAHDHSVQGVTVASKDVDLDKQKGTWMRIYLPQNPTTSLSLHHSNKLPVIVYFHGGGFCFLSAATAAFDHVCAQMAAKLGVIVVSVDYRLAPEHRLPAAFDDCFAALQWLQAQAELGCSDPAAADPWLAAHANLSCCFLMGVSSGATYLHHVGIRAIAADLGKVKIRGHIMVVPAFAGMSRTLTELKYADQEELTLKNADQCWHFALPLEADRDHPYCNPLSPQSPDIGSLDLPPTLVVIADSSLMVAAAAHCMLHIFKQQPPHNFHYG
ncbi:hypothetical protein O6H91_09G115600 [Diphasiastrum complanatum]|uniref:Uncharacterized protein n=1 Tax=Diphasiastrum complanatum TaxID=34168 RepID=A0ACC2CTW4_DIPCM|nr:hypothetical protein O6H91_09G115600 [Diphasiastrum complanatum]